MTSALSKTYLDKADSATKATAPALAPCLRPLGNARKPEIIRG